MARSLLNRGMTGTISGGGGANAEMAASTAMQTMGVIPAQTQLSTALAINLGTNGKPVRSRRSCLLTFFFFWLFRHILKANEWYLTEEAGANHQQVAI